MDSATKCPGARVSSSVPIVPAQLGWPQEHRDHPQMALSIPGAKAEQVVGHH